MPEESISLTGTGFRRDGLRRMGSNMQDFWMLLFTVVFFGLAFGYVYACQKLR
jgi:hypothetical protein